MNKNLQKQVKIYAGVVSAILASEKMSGQIIYHDFNPDTLLAVPNCTQAYFEFDLNNDSINDLRFSLHICTPSTSSSYGCTKRRIFLGGDNGTKLVEDLMTCSANSTTYPNSPVVKPLNAIQIVDFNLPLGGGGWIHSSQTCNGSWVASHCGEWINNQNKYIGFKIVQGGANYYGWMRARMIGGVSILIKSYAYNSIPDAPILTGDTINASLGISELNLSFHFTQHNNLIELNSSVQLENATIKVYDLLSREILRQNFSGHQTKITINKKGIYIVEVISDKGSYRKKVFMY